MSPANNCGGEFRDRRPAKVLTLVSSEPIDIHVDGEPVPHMVDVYADGMTVTRPVDAETPAAVREALGDEAP